VIKITAPQIASYCVHVLGKHKLKAFI